MTATTSQLRQRARQYAEAGLMGDAQQAMQQLVDKMPDDPLPRIELAMLMQQRGQLRASTEQLLHAVPGMPDEPALLVQMAQRLYFNGEIVTARSCLDRLERLPSPQAALLAEQARLRWMLGEFVLARDLIERAMAAGADTPDAYYLCGMLCQYTGGLGRAGEVLETCLRRWPRFGEAAVALANLGRQTAAANHLDLFRDLLGRLRADSRERGDLMARAGLESACFKTLDDMGCRDEAWEALARSNAIMHELHPYDPAAESALNDALIRAGDTVAGLDGPSVSHEGPVPVFIVGMTRSGTTLLDRMLSSHSQVATAGEINDFRRQLRWMTDIAPGDPHSTLEMLARTPQIDFAELGARYLEQTQWRAQGRRFYVDKLPINVRMVPFIRRALPKAPILHMVRDPMDVCFSNLKAMLGASSAYSYDMPDMAHYHGQQSRLARHWRMTWPGAMLDVSYAALVSDTEATLRRVLAHCDLDWEDACLHPERNDAPVATPSASQVREAVHTRSLGEWRHYASQLAPLHEALAAS